MSSVTFLSVSDLEHWFVSSLLDYGGDDDSSDGKMFSADDEVVPYVLGYIVPNNVDFY